MFSEDVKRLWSRVKRQAGVRARSSSRLQQETFTAIFRENAWGDAESVPGRGSTEAPGADFRDELIALLDLLATTFVTRAKHGCTDRWMARCQ